MQVSETRGASGDAPVVGAVRASYLLIEVEVQPLDDGLAANLAIPARLTQLGRVVAQVSDLGEVSEQSSNGRLALSCFLRGSRPAREQVDHGGSDRPADAQGTAGRRRMPYTS